MRCFVMAVLLGFATVAPISAVRALERAPQVVSDDADSWIRSGDCTVRYYNICTGWAWRYVMSGGEKLGTVIDACDGESLLELTRMYVFSSGYSSLATISTHEVDGSGTPMYPPLAQQDTTWGCDFPNWNGCYAWRTWNWNIVVPQTFMVLIEQYWFTKWEFAPTFERSAAGPTGPPACGLCYPVSRVTNTFLWPDGPITGPGTRIHDGGCDVEMLLTCILSPLPTPVEATSWGSVKALYR